MPRTLGQSNEVRLELRRGTAVSVTIGGCQGSGTEPLVFLAEECGDRVSIHRAVRPSRFTLPGERNGSGLSASAIATRAQVLAGTLKSPWDPGGSLKAVGKSPWIKRLPTSPSLLGERHSTGGATGVRNHYKAHGLLGNEEQFKFSKPSYPLIYIIYKGLFFN